MGDDVATQDFGLGGILLCAVLVGLGCGLVNGVLIAYGGMVPFIATLAMLASARGLALQISDGKTQVVTVEAGPGPRAARLLRAGHPAARAGLRRGHGARLAAC